jgi:hypothetical protein
LETGWVHTPSFGCSPNNTSLGDLLIVPFFALLWTSVATASQLAQSSWLTVMSRRYCSTHWLVRSARPSVCGWNAVERFCVMPNSWVKARPKWDVKRGSLSLITFCGIPNHRYTLSRYILAIWGPVIVVEHGMNKAAREHPWSTIVRIASWPRLFGRPVMRSIATCEKGVASDGGGMRNNGVLTRCVRFLFCWHVAHPLTYSWIHVRAWGQWYCSVIFRVVSSLPGWPMSG